MSPRYWMQLIWLLILFSTQPLYAQRGPAVVELQQVVKRQNLATAQATVGTVEATRTAVVGSAVDGRVVELLVREGDRVEKDEPLAQLLTETIMLEVEAAEAELELKKEELAELENGTRQEELAQTSARLEATRIVADYRERERKRLQGLRDASAISASEYEDAVSLALEAQQRYEEAKAAHQLALAGPRDERIAQARAQVRIRDAIARRLRDQLKKHTIYSRFAGYVTAEATEVGQWVSRGDPVAEIIALDQVDVVVKVLESYIPFLHVGDAVSIEVPALNTKPFTGKVVSIVPQADRRSRTFPVKIRIDNQISDAGQPMIKAGMLARAQIPVGRSQEALLVPKDALVLGGSSPIVWTIDKQSIKAAGEDMRLGSAIPVPVTMGESEGEMIEVSGNLEEGTLIVVRGNERIPFSPPGKPPSQVTWSES